MDDGKRVVDALRRLSKEFLDLDIDQSSSARGHQFWALATNSGNKSYRDILGNIDAEAMRAFNSKFQDSDAGFRSSAHKYVGFSTHADVFLINEDHIKKLDETIGPMLVHEACHFADQIGRGKKGVFTEVDAHNAKEILCAYYPEVRALHTLTWARLMARAGRHAVEKNIEALIADYIEKAIPYYDRPNWQRSKIREQ